MVAQQQSMGKEKGIVMDGRDIGTTVFPDAFPGNDGEVSHHGFQGFVQVLVREELARERLAGGEYGFQLLDGGVMQLGVVQRCV